LNHEFAVHLVGLISTDLSTTFKATFSPVRARMICRCREWKRSEFWILRFHKVT